MSSMHKSASKRSVSSRSDVDVTPSTLLLVLVGVDGYLRGYQVNLAQSEGRTNKGQQQQHHQQDQQCVLRWKTKLPGLREGGLATCAARTFTPPFPAATSGAPQAADLVRQPSCSHCRNALFEYELQQQAAQSEAERQAVPLAMMPSEAYLPENWLAVFPPSVPDPSQLTRASSPTFAKPEGTSAFPGPPSCTSPSSGGTHALTLSPGSVTGTCGDAGAEEEDVVPLVRRPHWFWWEAPESERLPPVECLCPLNQGQNTTRDGADSTDNNAVDAEEQALGSWVPFAGASWNRGSCAWHRLAPLSNHQDTFVELNVSNGVLHGLGDVMDADEDDIDGAHASAAAPGQNRKSNTASPSSAASLPPIFVPLLLRTHCTKLFTAAPARLVEGQDSSGRSTSTTGAVRRAANGVGRRAYLAAATPSLSVHSAGQVTADLRDTELVLPLALTAHERQLAQRISSVVRCAADGVVDILATAPPLSALSLSSPLSPDTAAAAAPVTSYGSHLDELLERVEVEVATLAAFAVALVTHHSPKSSELDKMSGDGSPGGSTSSREALVLPLPVHAAEMEEALSVSTGVEAWRCRSARAQPRGAHESADTLFPASSSPSSPCTCCSRHGADTVASGLCAQASLASVAASSITPGFARERMISGLLLQSGGAPMQLVQGARPEEGRSPVPAAGGIDEDAYKASSAARWAAPRAVATAADSLSDDDEDDDETSSDTSSDSSSSSSSALDSVTTSSTRVSFLMPTRSESGVWTAAAPPALATGKLGRTQARRGGPSSSTHASAGAAATTTSAPAVVSFFDENFDPVLLLGRGTSGAALLARHRTTGVFYAVKVLLVRDYESERAILHELNVHATLSNRHLVRYHACWSEFVTPKRAMQLSFVGLCDRQEALALPAPASPDPSPRGGSLYLHGNSVSEEQLHVHNGHRRPVAAAVPDTFRGGAPPAPYVPRRMHWGSLQLGSTHTMMGGPRLLIGEESLSGTSLSSMATTTEKQRRPPRQGRRPAKPVLAHAYNSTAAVVDVCPSSDSDADPSVTHGRVGDGARRMPSARHLSLADLDDDDDEDDDDGEEEEGDADNSLFDGSEYRPGTVIGSRLIFLQMEYCQTTLAHHLVQRTRIDRVENLVILLQLVTGLRYMHHCRLLHRDVKPTNIFVDFRCQLGSSPVNPSSSDDDEDVEADILSPFAAGAEAGALVDPHCTTLSCLPHSTSLWSMGSSLAHRPEASDLDNGSTDDLVQQDYRELVNSLAHRGSDEMLRARKNQHVRKRGELLSEPTSAARGAAAEPTSVPTPKSVPLSPRADALLRKDYRWILERLVQVRIGDFGLAKPIQSQAPFDVHGDGFHSMNNANTVGVGSPVYSSPEQLSGRHCTSASDAYSLGIVMAEMYLMPTTVAERLVTLREVRDGAFPTAALQKQYPELALVKALTNPLAARRLPLQAVHRQLKKLLIEHLQRALFTDAQDASSEPSPRREESA